MKSRTDCQSRKTRIIPLAPTKISQNQPPIAAMVVARKSSFENSPAHVRFRTSRLLFGSSVTPARDGGLTLDGAGPPPIQRRPLIARVCMAGTCAASANPARLPRTIRVSPRISNAIRALTRQGYFPRGRRVHCKTSFACRKLCLEQDCANRFESAGALYQVRRSYRFASWRTWKTLHFSENKPRCAAVKLATVQTRCCK